MSELGDDTYSPKMTQIESKERYGDCMRLLTRGGKSNITVLDRVSDKEQRKGNVNDESKRIVKIAAKLIREIIRNFDHSASTYP